MSKFNKICAMGDFNFPTIHQDWAWMSASNNGFIDTLQDAYLIQKIEKPTRHRANQASNLVDLILSFKNRSLASVSKSDHEVLVLQPCVAEDLNQKRQYRYNTNKADFNKWDRCLIMLIRNQLLIWMLTSSGIVSRSLVIIAWIAIFPR